MARENRVAPDGRLLAGPDRGLFWGNRGPLLDRHGDLARHSSGRRWLVCVLEFKGRRRVQWQPGRLTELYFLDEATALAAGHRPCAECRLEAHRAFVTAWHRAHPDEPPGVTAMDARLHADRLVGRPELPDVHRRYDAELTGLPDGVMVELDGRTWLVRGEQLLAWTPGGYAERRSRSGVQGVSVVTPRSTVGALVAGYRPVLHPTAG
jgi:hypothetical protein